MIRCSLIFVSIWVDLTRLWWKILQLGSAVHLFYWILNLRICSFLLPLELVLFPVLCSSEASAGRLVLGLDGSVAQGSAREQQLLFFFCAATYSHFLRAAAATAACCLLDLLEIFFNETFACDVWISQYSIHSFTWSFTSYSVAVH